MNHVGAAAARLDGPVSGRDGCSRHLDLHDQLVAGLVNSLAHLEGMIAAEAGDLRAATLPQPVRARCGRRCFGRCV